jgi:hypothetical protein
LEYNRMFIRKVFDCVSREELQKCFIEFGIPTKLVWLVKICLSETCGKVHLDKCLLNTFPIQNGLKQGDSLLPLVFNFP